jgi:hypothetical protein
LYRQSYYPYNIISLITMVSSVLLPLWYRQSYYHGIVSLINHGNKTDNTIWIITLTIP